jgi:AAA15 family ATPase/GTPase
MTTIEEKLIDLIGSEWSDQEYCDLSVQSMAFSIKESVNETLFTLRRLQRQGRIEVLSDGFGTIGVYLTENNGNIMQWMNGL